MTDALLERFAYTPFGTFGVLSMGGWRWSTLEDVWLGNKPNISCIPEGVYDLIPHTSTKYAPPIYAMLNPSLGIRHQPMRGDPQGTRYACLFAHVANTADNDNRDGPTDDVDGCIGLGMGLGIPDGRWGLVRSVDAIAEWKKVAAKMQPKTLEIRFNPQAGLYAIKG